MAIRLSRTFILRKLHQLTGIMPLGFFLLEHFYTNSKALSGAADFNTAVKDLQSIPYILFVEIGGIFIPLIYHAVYGMVITVEARPNNLHYPYARNWFYTIQRVTGMILFFSTAHPSHKNCPADGGRLPDSFRGGIEIRRRSRNRRPKRTSHRSP